MLRYHSTRYQLTVEPPRSGCSLVPADHVIARRVVASDLPGGVRDERDRLAGRVAADLLEDAGPVRHRLEHDLRRPGVVFGGIEHRQLAVEDGDVDLLVLPRVDA